MEGEHLQSPHDRLFKQTFGRVESAAAFFKDYLPAELAAAIDWQTLTPAVGTTEYTEYTKKGRRRELTGGKISVRSTQLIGPPISVCSVCSVVKQLRGFKKLVFPRPIMFRGRPWS